jgi:2-iminobutanoate/2-iminopropanoate deaminase
MAMDTNKKVVQTSDAPSAIGPYSQAIRAGDFIFVSGQIALDPQTGGLVDGGIAEQTQQVLKNIAGILKAAGSDMTKVIKTTVFLADLNDFQKMNEAYGHVFKANPPARATVQVSRLPRDVRIEIDAIALA